MNQYVVAISLTSFRTSCYVDNGCNAQAIFNKKSGKSVHVLDSDAEVENLV